MERCEDCGGRLDRPGIFGCEGTGHPAPDLAQRIAAAIERDANGRRGMRWDGISDDVQDQIRDSWVALIRKELDEAGRA